MQRIKVVPSSDGRMYSNRALLRLLLPLLVEQTLVVLVGMADALMVSSLGDAAVSGVNLIDQMCYVIIVLLSSLATGGAVVASQLLGARRREEACGVANQLFIVALATALSIMLPVLLLRRQLICLVYGSLDSAVMENATTYLMITAWSYPFLALYNAGAALFRSMGRSSVTMRVSLLVNVVNVCGNALGVFVFRLGVAGVAIPTLLSHMVGAACMLVLSSNRALEIHIIPHGWRPNGALIREILHIGIPNGVENSLFQLGRVLVVGAITVFGTAQIAANAVANTMDTLGCLPGAAMNLAIVTVVGQCVGAGDYAQARYYTKKLVLWAYIGFVAVCGTTLLTLQWTLPCFGISPEALALARRLVTIHNSLAMLMWPVGFVLPNALRAASDVRYTMVVSLTSMAVFRIGFSYILGRGLGWGAVGVWWAMIIDWICRCSCFLLRYRSGRWESKARIHAST